MENFSCSMSGQGFCPYEKNGGECIVEGNCTNKISNKFVSKFGLEIEVLEKALSVMKIDNYIESTATVEDLEDFAYSMCEGLAWYAKSKIKDWASEFEE